MRLCKKLNKIFLKLKSCVSGFCRMSNLHGFRNIAAENVKWQESCFWLVICASGTLMTVIMFSTVWGRFQRSPTVTTIETNNYPIKNVPFPAVTICNLNKILRTSFELVAEKFERHGVDRSILRTFLKKIPQIYSTRMTKFGYEELINNAMKELGYNLESLMLELSQPCSQFLIRCLWLGEDYDCSTLFIEVKTPEGFCCSFNWRGKRQVMGYENTFIRSPWKSKNQSFYADNIQLFVNEASTSLAGLTVVVDPDESNFFASVDSFFGSVIILHNSLHYPDNDAPRVFVQPRSEAIVRLRASVIESSGNVRSLKIHQRQCYFEEEHSMEDETQYSYEVCSLECKLFTFSQKCGCIPFYYQNDAGARTCELSDMKCISENRVLASQDTETATEDWGTKRPGGYCRCLPSCNDVNYDLFFQGNNIRHPEYASPIFENKMGNRSAISVFFEQNVCIKYRMESLVTWDSVIASFGGIFGICLGGSIISLIELFYYFLYDYWKFYGRGKELEPTTKVLVGKHRISLVSTSRVGCVAENRLSRNVNLCGAYPWVD